MASDDEERAERILHEAVWTTLQRATSDAEQAIREARGLLYAVRSHLDDPQGSPFKPATLRELIDQWLDHFGRDERKEAEARGSRP